MVSFVRIFWDNVFVQLLPRDFFSNFFFVETERFIITTLREKRHPELTCTEAAEKLAKEYEK